MPMFLECSDAEEVVKRANDEGYDIWNALASYKFRVPYGGVTKELRASAQVQYDGILTGGIKLFNAECNTPYWRVWIIQAGRYAYAIGLGYLSIFVLGQVLHTWSAISIGVLILLINHLFSVRNLIVAHDEIIERRKYNRRLAKNINAFIKRYGGKG
jgi:hypothetical protein